MKKYCRSKWFSQGRNFNIKDCCFVTKFCIVQNYNIKKCQLDMVYVCVYYACVCVRLNSNIIRYLHLVGLETTQSVAQIGQGDDNSTTA